ncbi:MAG: 4a-hydroxytetrahydrobiopterin dehydratase [Rhodanobacteraceae bacterium]
MSIEALRSQHCKPRKGRENRLDVTTIAGHLADLPGWKEDGDSDSISKEFKFADYFHTMAFVNAVASIAHREDHHPDLEVGYSRCVVRYSTHDVGGLSLNDFICAAKVEDAVTGNK